MRRLRDLIQGIPVKEIIGDPEVEIQDIAYHSARVRKGMLFVSVRGTRVDGHAFIKEALKRGAVALVVERNGIGDYGVPVVVVTDSRAALAHVSAAFFEDPSRKMKIIGITGTNGKTTTSFLIEAILKDRALPCGVMGTISYRYGGRTLPAPMTTPESYDLQKMLREMLGAGVTHVVMEVSSHALDLQRVNDCHFDVGIFTNFTQDHLDYHLDLDTYRRCKERLFTSILPRSDKKNPVAVLNLDDPVGESLWQGLAYRKIGYGVQKRASLWASDVTDSLSGVSATFHTAGGDIKIRSALIGEFNIYNMMAAIGATLALGIPQDSIARGIESLAVVPGRMERIPNSRGLEIFVDYAHTPDALGRALKILRPLRNGGRLITVFGCGGDRDRNKRPIMGRLAAELSDISILTSDNPRSESPGEIIRDIEGGLLSGNVRTLQMEDLQRGLDIKGYLKIEDRREAIGLAIRAARSGDLVLIAGKGHENTQILGDERVPFDDREEVRKALGLAPRSG